jgi:hypothetical protein
VRRRRPPKPPNPLLGVCKSLVRVDGTAIRRKLKQDYEKALRDLNRARQQIDYFHTEDLPKFARWLNSTFGAMLTELREIERRVREHQLLLLEVEQEIFATGASNGRAYARVLNRRQNPDREPPLETSQSNRNAADECDFEPFNDNELNDLDDLFSDILGIPRSPRRSRAKAQQPGDEGPRLKELYRALARLLHPDVQQRMTPQKLERWHQTQEAYQKGDIEQLEIILTLSEIDEKGTTDQTSCSLLQQITKKLKSSYRNLRAKVAQCRRDPAWGFARRTNNYALEVKLRRQLDEDLLRLKLDLRSLEGLLAEYAIEAKRLRKQRPRTRRRPGYYEFIF